MKPSKNTRSSREKKTQKSQKVPKKYKNLQGGGLGCRKGESQTKISRASQRNQKNLFFHGGLGSKKVENQNK